MTRLVQLGDVFDCPRIGRVVVTVRCVLAPDALGSWVVQDSDGVEWFDERATGQYLGHVTDRMAKGLVAL